MRAPGGETTPRSATTGSAQSLVTRRPSRGTAPGQAGGGPGIPAPRPPAGPSLLRTGESRGRQHGGCRWSDGRGGRAGGPPLSARTPDAPSAGAQPARSGPRPRSQDSDGTRFLRVLSVFPVPLSYLLKQGQRGPGAGLGAPGTHPDGTLAGARGLQAAEPGFGEASGLRADGPPSPPVSLPRDGKPARVSPAAGKHQRTRGAARAPAAGVPTRGFLHTGPVPASDTDALCTGAGAGLMRITAFRKRLSLQPIADAPITLDSRLKPGTRGLGTPSRLRDASTRCGHRARRTRPGAKSLCRVLRTPRPHSGRGPLVQKGVVEITCRPATRPSAPLAHADPGHTQCTLHNPSALCSSHSPGCSIRPGCLGQTPPLGQGGLPATRRLGSGNQGPSCRRATTPGGARDRARDSAATASAFTGAGRTHELPHTLSRLRRCPPATHQPATRWAAPRGVTERGPDAARASRQRTTRNPAPAPRPARGPVPAASGRASPALRASAAARRPAAPSSAPETPA